MLTTMLNMKGQVKEIDLFKDLKPLEKTMSIRVSKNYWNGAKLRKKSR